MTDTLTARVARTALITAIILVITAIGGRAWRERSAVVPTASTSPAADIVTMLAELEARVKTSPNDPEGWQMLGWSLFQTQRFADAARAYGRAATLAPDKSEYWSSLGEALVMAGSGNVSAPAKAAFDKAVAIDPKDPRARYFLGMARDLAGDHKGAIDAWLALLADSPAGAPWEADVRRTVEQVGKKDGIDVAARLAAMRPAPPAAATPPAGQDAMIAGMVGNLAAKLKADSRNVDGWIMLMRSYATLNRPGDAAAAYRAGKAANPQASATLDAAAKALGIVS